MSHTKTALSARNIHVSAAANKGSGESSNLSDNVVRKEGLTNGSAVFFLVTQMAGAGFLALPRAVADAGWCGLVLIVTFCILVGIAAIRLGRCWEMLEERWEEYRKPNRQPYKEMAYRSLGVYGRRIASAAVILTAAGNTTVFIILTSQMMNSVVPRLSVCEWVFAVAIVLLPLTWLGTPKDFWQMSVLAVSATVTAILIIIVKLALEDTAVDVNYRNPTMASFSLGYGAILFSFGGASVFPTIQNDMRNRSDFWKSVIIGFSIILSLYLPVAILGYIRLGYDVSSNIILSIEKGPVVTAAICLEIINLLGTYLISFSTLAQAVEDILNIPRKFCWQRALSRACLVSLEVLICLAVPDFGLILNLMGGSTVTLVSFILPPVMYMTLIGMKGEEHWPKRELPLWERICLYEIVTIGVIGGLCATASALFAILRPESFSNSCFANFDLSVEVQQSQ